MKLKVLPCPGSLTTQISPPMSCTSWLLMASPRPVPPYLRVVELSAWVKGLKRDSRCCGVMPMPVSVTEKRKVTSAPSCASSSTSTSTFPFSVNLMALLVMFKSTWPRRSGSPNRESGTFSLHLICSSIGLSRRMAAATVCRSLKTEAGVKAMLSSSILPASALEKSRMSLITPRSTPEAVCALSR